MLSDENKARVQRLVKAGYWQAFSEMVRRMNVAFWWSGIVDGQLRRDKMVLAPPDDAYWPEHPDTPMNQDFGGQSGGPVYRIIDANLKDGGSEPVDRLELVGFIYNKVLGAVLARPAALVRPDGTLAIS